MEVKVDDPWECIQTFQGVQFYRLYKNPASTLVIFRQRLSSLAQSLVLTLLSLSRPLCKTDLALMIRPDSTISYTRAIQSLQQYHILQTVKYKAADAYKLTPEFVQSFKQVLTGSDKSHNFGTLKSESSSDPIPRIALDEYATRQWNSILGFVVGMSSSSTEGPVVTPSINIIHLLLSGQLMSGPQPVRSASQLTITKAGFAFVLENLNTQLWVLLFLCVSKAAVDGYDAVEALSFIFLISILEPGHAYSTTSFNETQCHISETLSSLGIIYLPDQADVKKAAYFFPTQLVTMLSTTPKAASVSDMSLRGLNEDHNEANSGFVIVETNFRVYAYTSSPLQIALLSLFVNLRSRHPNLVTGKVTRLSIQRAVRQGISADQIISYLNSHAHPRMRATQAKSAQEGRSLQSSLLPTTVVDQIHLWQLERDRMTMAEGFLLQDFETPEKYRTCCRRAEERGLLVWKQDKKNMLFVNLSSTTALRTFMEL